MALTRNVIIMSAMLSAWIWSSSCTETIHKKKANPCAAVSCYFNAMCVVDQTTDAAMCVCPENECDDIPAMPVCASGITFKSPCHAQMHSCRSQKLVKIQYAGQCGKQTCSPFAPCPFNARCVLGECQCVRCRHVDERRRFSELDLTRSRAVCGSDGATYESRCHLRYESCVSRTPIYAVKESVCQPKRKSPVQRNAPVRSFDNHFLVWKSFDPLGKGRNDKDARTKNINMMDSYEEICRQFELRGCLPLRHSRAWLLGTYTIVRERSHLGSPVYIKEKVDGSSSAPVYLSRYNSTRFRNGSWVVGSKIGSGVGWFGVNDQSTRPEDITGTWYSTAGPPTKPWVAEPKLSGSCVERKEKKDTGRGCDLGQERGPLGINWQSATQRTPLYELKIKRPQRAGFYRPGRKLTIEIIANNRARRFKAAFVSFQNEVGECGALEITKASRRVDLHCDNSVASVLGRPMKRVAIHFKAPPRGCVIFKALVKSSDGEVFYDDETGYLLTSLPLTKKICHVGYTPPTSNT